MTYAEKGRLSKAWFIQFIKRKAGITGDMSLYLFVRGSDLDFTTFKLYLGDLMASRYIQQHHQKSAVGKVYYSLTTLGQRYLNEHREELIEPEKPQTRPIVTTPVEKRVVPATPATPEIASDVAVAPPPEVKPAQAPPKPKPKVRTHTPPPEPVVEPPAEPSPPPAPTAKEESKPSLEEQARAALNDILYDRYADEVTARELIERLSEREEA